MNVIVTGASGLIGAELLAALRQAGHTPLPAVRHGPAGHGQVVWNVETGEFRGQAAEHCDAVVHLAGENIAAGRWTSARKTRIRDSRVNATRALCDALSRAPHPPRTFLCGSAVGFYGHRGDETMTEQSPAGAGFLAQLCQDWESACGPLRAAGTRVANLRFGVVLSARGGALARMLTPFRLGLGGVVGPGTQYMSWISLPDAAVAIIHILENETITGPVNVVSPHPVTNRAFTKSLGKVIGRWTPFPMPAFAARLAFGELADALLLASTRVAPAALQESAFKYRFEALDAALRHAIA